MKTNQAIIFAIIVLSFNTANASEVSDFLKGVSNDLASDKQKITSQRKQHVKESYEATQSGPIAKYVEEHKTPDPTTLGSPIVISPYHFSRPVQSRDDGPVPVIILNE